ncbi:Gfo/Idh/MocA family oxidoreductase [Mycoplasmatota bacterium WC30]
MRLTNKDEKITISIVGAGNRATAYIKTMERDFKGLFTVVAIFEPKKELQEYFRKQYSIDESMIFDDYKYFLKMDRISDVVIIATLDDMHLEPALAAIAKGYDIILEKPISKSLEETVRIGERPKKYDDQLIAVCHVLRHSPFFAKLKEIIDSKRLGEIIDIQHNENVGYYHFAHSYVRGNWRNTDIAAPFIVAKSCHDMDILLYLLKDKHCLKLSSFGNLTFFNHNNYDDKKMAPRCQDCKIEKDCPYSALSIYNSGKMRSVVFNNSSVETLKNELADSIYGRCVFNSDNNVPDHQVSIIEFENGVHATFNLSAFSNEIHRSIKIMCEYGEIRAIESKEEIEIAPFGKQKEIIYTEKLAGGHGGADSGFVKNFMNTYIYGQPFDSTLEMSIESHIMAFAAEYSRINSGEVVEINEFHKDTISKIRRKNI